MNLTLVRTDKKMRWLPGISKMLLFPLCLKQVRMIRSLFPISVFQWLIIGCNFNKCWPFIRRTTAATPVSKTARYTSYQMSFLMQVGLVPRNNQALESPGARGGCFPWHPLASVGARAHPCPLWAPSPLLRNRLREPIRPRNPPLVIGEENGMFAYVLRDLRLP